MAQPCLFIGSAMVRPGYPPPVPNRATPPPEVAALALALGGGLEPELLFGIGGGSGFGRFIYGPIVTLLTRITTSEHDREAFLANVCKRLGAPYRPPVASSEPALPMPLQT